MWKSSNPEPKDKLLCVCKLGLHSSQIYSKENGFSENKNPRQIFNENQIYWIETKWTGGKPYGDDLESSVNRMKWFMLPFERLMGNNRYKVYNIEGYSCFIIDEIQLEKHFMTIAQWREKQINSILDE